MSTNEKDPNGRDPHQPGAKLDAGKQLAWLCISGFALALKEIAEVTTVGARKYTPDGWKSVPNGEDRYMQAFARHMLTHAKGETHDRDTGCLHLAHMIWNLLAALQLKLERESKTPSIGGEQ